MIIYSERTQCIFCNNHNLVTILEKDYDIFLGNYNVIDPNSKYYSMPYNIQSCSECLTIQTKYIGDLNIIYGSHTVGAYGSIRSTHNKLFALFILENPDINSILEVGAGNGELSDIILENKKILYTINDPSYGGNVANKQVISSFFEETDNNLLLDNTLVMSHVFEHFYKPLSILKKLQSMKTLKYIYISLPDFETYIKQGNYHLLNPEHTYYVETQFLENTFLFHGFKIVRKYYHENHSIFLEFIRTDSTLSTFPKNLHSVSDITMFFKNILNNISNINNLIKNTTKEIYVWPCSVQILFIFALGLHQYKILNVLDNSPLKIGRYLYGCNLYCKSLNEVSQTNSDKIIILTGGCYNKEILNTIQTNPNNTVIIA
jgi:hypothetical protein